MPGDYQQVVFAHAKPLRGFWRTWSVFLYVLLPMNLLSITVMAAQPPSTNEQEQIDKLIAALVSPNKQPSCEESLPPVYPSDYDHAAQDRVRSARDALLAKGMAAFPGLIRHVHDRRYSDTEQRGKSFWVNVHVGYVCYHIIALQVEVYQPLVTLPPPKRIWLPFGQDDLDKWWESHKHVNLREIQLEGAKWALNQQRNAHFRNKEEETAVLGDLKRLVKRLESSDKPIQVDSSGRYVNEPDLVRTKWKR